MKKTKGYPLLQINKDKIYSNAKRVVEFCSERGIGVAGVIKGVNGIECITEEFIKAGCNQIASSRLEQLVTLKKRRSDVKTMLLRIPMKSEICELVKYVDISLNSETETIEYIEKVCEKFGRKHSVVLMMDLGDLREGFINPHELFDLAIHIERNLKHLYLAGIGTNLSCFGSVKPSRKNLGLLCHLADWIETTIGRKLDIISGGNTSSMPLLVEGQMPDGINHLRIGEAILLNMDLPRLWKVDLGGMSNETFVLKAQIVEIKSKPSRPLGELFVDAYGNLPDFPDKGMRKRAILAIGKQDFAVHDKLVPVDRNVEIIGSSSDHTIVDIESSENSYKIGDIMEFNMYYGPMVHLCSSDWVRKTY